MRKFSDVSSKSHMWGMNENQPQAKQMVKFFHSVLHSGLLYNVDNFKSLCIMLIISYLCET